MKRIKILIMTGSILLFSACSNLLMSDEKLMELAFMTKTENTKAFYSFMQEGDYAADDLQDFSTDDTTQSFLLKKKINYQLQLEDDSIVTVIKTPIEQQLFEDVLNLLKYSQDDEMNYAKLEETLTKVFEDKKSLNLHFSNEYVTTDLAFNVKSDDTLNIIIKHSSN